MNTQNYEPMTPEDAASKGAAMLAHLAFVGCPVPEAVLFEKCECRLDDFQHLTAIMEEGGYINIAFTLVTATDTGYQQGCEVLDAMRQDGLPIPPNHPRTNGIPAGGTPDSGWTRVQDMKKEPTPDSKRNALDLAVLLASLADYPDAPMPVDLLLMAWKCDRAQFEKKIMPLIRNNLITIDNNNMIHLTLKGNAVGRALNIKAGMKPSASDPD